MAFCGGREQKTIIFFSFPEVLWNSILEKFAIICRIERDGKKATKFEVARVLFLSDIFVAIAVVVA